VVDCVAVGAVADDVGIMYGYVGVGFVVDADTVDVVAVGAGCCVW